MADNTAAMERYQLDVKFYNEHYHELLNRYPEQWIVIHDGQILGSGADLEVLFKRLKAEGHPLSHVFVKFMSNEPEVLIMEERH